MNTVKREIDFSKIGGPVYVGRDNGEAARKKFGIDRLDEGGMVLVNIPDDTYSVNSSYFLGMFGASITRFKSKERFLEHYDFHAPNHVMKDIQRHINRALKEKGLLGL